MNNIPRHIAIIMDGNGRWAERNGVPRSQGHAEGAQRVRDVMEFARIAGVEYLTLYAFSTENWKRSEEEVSALMELLAHFLESELAELQEKGIRLLATGRIDELPEKPRKRLYNVMEATGNNKKGNLILALNYGGRSEIADAARAIAQQVLDGRLSPDQIDEKCFSKHLYLPEIPDPDLMIRTAGEYRLSNFLLWELSYAEFYVTETLWPDFLKEDFDKALAGYANRDRRFGGRKEKI